MTILYVAAFAVILAGFICLALHYAKTSKPIVFELRWLVVGWVCVLIGAAGVAAAVGVQNRQWKDNCHRQGGVVQGLACVKQGP